MATPHILLVGNEHATVHSVNTLLTVNSFPAEAVRIGPAALAKVYRDPIPDLVLLELGRDGEGLRTLQRLRQLRPELKVVVLSQAGDNRRVVEAIRLGAQDYITLPFHDHDLLQLLKRHLNPGSEKELELAETIEEVGGDHVFLAGSPAMQKIRLQAELLADIDVPVLILGESGTGKEVTAHLIHKLSGRSNRRLLKVNCAALPSELLESELFGYERGAFTGATRTKAGKFELCEKGTILLDEVAEMPANLQAKLLHVLQDKEFFRLGGETTIDVDVRILAATNVNIQQAMEERKFRPDLYYRLSAFTICLPPLRSRREEIPSLLRHFMQETASQYSRRPLSFSQRLLDACLQYSWPGNVRELQNFVKRYVVMADENAAITELHTGHRRSKLEVYEQQPSPNSLTSEPVAIGGSRSERDLKFLVRTLKEDVEIQAITTALSETDWNRKKAARLLHISYRGLLNKIRQHASTRPPVNHEPAQQDTSRVGNLEWQQHEGYAHAAAAAEQSRITKPAPTIPKRVADSH